MVAVPADIVVCDGDPITFTPPTASDNCDATPLVSGVRSDGLSFSDPYPLGMTTISYTTTDDCGNSSSDSFTITVNENPICVITGPDNVVCETSDSNYNLVAYPSYLSGNSIGGFSYSWTITSGSSNGWSLNANSGQSVNFNAGIGTAVFEVVITDANGCQTYCNYTISNCITIDDEYCTYTQGFYGNQGGIQFGQSTIQIITNQLSKDLDGDGIADPLVIGKPGRSLTIDATNAQCIIDRLPGNGSPSKLPAGDVVLTLPNCDPSPIPVGSGGRIKNIFLTQMIALSLNVRNDPTLCYLQLSEIPCLYVPTGVYKKLPNKQNATICDLIECGNCVIGGSSQCKLKPGQLTDIIGQINEIFNECRTLSDPCPALARVSEVYPQFVYLSAEWADQNVQLNWELDRDIEPEQLIIERSVDGSIFEVLETDLLEVISIEEASSKFAFADNSLDYTAVPVRYYRVSLMLSNGQRIKSEVIQLSPNFDARMKLFPNPTNAKFSLQYESAVELQNAQVVISNDLEQIVFSQKLAGNSINGRMTIPVVNWSEGLYLVRIIHDDGVLVDKLQKL